MLINNKYIHITIKSGNVRETALHNFKSLITDSTDQGR